MEMKIFSILCRKYASNAKKINIQIKSFFCYKAQSCDNVEYFSHWKKNFRNAVAETE